jgi:hypothetical protein
VELPTVHVNVTVTLELFQPFALGGGDAWAEIAGAVAVAATVSVTLLEADPRDAEIMAFPLAIPVAKPLALIVATPELLEVQFTSVVIFWVLPSVYVPVAVNCWVPPTSMPGIEGCTAMDARLGSSVKLRPLLATPETVTLTVKLPVVVPAGTDTPMLDAVQFVTGAATPLNVTVLEPWVAPKFAPVRVTAVPIVPDAGEMLVTLGGGGATVTVVEPQTEPVQALIVAEPSATA